MEFNPFVVDAAWSNDNDIPPTGRTLRTLHGEWGADDSVTMGYPTWTQNGACLSSNLPFDESSRDSRTVWRMIQVCWSCPVQGDCLDYAMELEGPGPAMFRAGIFGGETPLDRTRRWNRRLRLGDIAA